MCLRNYGEIFDGKWKVGGGGGGEGEELKSEGEISIYLKVLSTRLIFLTGRRRDKGKTDFFFPRKKNPKFFGSKC